MATVIGFLGSKTGAGTTSFVYHLAWLYAEQGYRVLAVDLDPQPNLTVRMVDEERLSNLWTKMVVDLDVQARGEVFDLVREPVASDLELLIGNPHLTNEEETLAQSWQHCRDGTDLAFHWLLSFHRQIDRAAKNARVDVVLVDLASSPSAINRAALLACQYVVTLVTADLLSTHELFSLLPRIREWRKEWRQLRRRNQLGRQGPKSFAEPVGFVFREHPLRVDRSTTVWAQRSQLAYAAAFELEPPTDLADDPNRLGTLKWYGSVLPMAEEARKPIFHLKPADGALGAHAAVVREARKNFEEIAARIARVTWQSDQLGSQHVP